MNSALALAGMLLAATTPASPPIPSSARAYLPNFTVNGQPAVMMFDTGAASSFLFDSSVPWLNLQFTPVPADNSKNPAGAESSALGLSAPAQIKFGADSFTAPFKVFSGDLWHETVPQKLDGAIGWPELRLNLLVFDPATHTISAPAALPDTNGWLKLSIRPANELLLEIPQPNGKTGLLLVDTGRPGGLALLPPQWKDWTTAHPEAGIGATILIHPTAPADRAKITTPLAWADEVKLGPLDLTQVPIEEVDFRDFAGLDNPVGVIGLGALERLDLVVDGPHNLAYLHPLPSGPMAKPGPDWTVAPSVRLNPHHLLADAPLFNAGLEFSAGNYDAAIADFDRTLELDPQSQAAALGRANAKLRKNDYAGAIADYNLVLTLNPNNLTAYGNRALARQNTGDVDGAIADFTHVLDADPNYAAIYNNRGFAKMIKDDFAGALPDFDQALAHGQRDAKTYFNRAKARFAQSDFAGAAADYANGLVLQPEANYPRFFFTLALRRLHRDDGPAGLAAAVPTWKDGWPKTVGLFLIGNLTEADFLAAAAADPKTAAPHQCEAFFYAGMTHLLKNEPDAARALFTQSVATGAHTLTESSFARLELARLSQPASTP